MHHSRLALFLLLLDPCHDYIYCGLCQRTPYDVVVRVWKTEHHVTLKVWSGCHDWIWSNALWLTLQTLLARDDVESITPAKAEVLQQGLYTPKEHAPYLLDAYANLVRRRCSKVAHHISQSSTDITNQRHFQSSGHFGRFGFFLNVHGRIQDGRQQSQDASVHR